MAASTITKARVKMSRIGLITKRQGYWQFSSVFSRSLTLLTEKLNSFKTPATTRDQEKKESFMIDIAKGGQ